MSAPRFRSLARPWSVLWLLILGASPTGAALQRFSLQRVPVTTSRSGFGPSGYGVFSLESGSLAQIARVGDAEPGGNGSYASIFSVTYGPSGHVAFAASLSGTSGGASDDGAIYRSDGAATVVIAREGQPAPGGFGTIAQIWPLFVDAAGNVFFTARLGGVGVYSAIDSGVFRGDGLTLVSIAREGTSAFGGAESFGDLAGILNYSSPAAAGAAALSVGLTGSGVGSGNDSAMLTSDGSTRVRIAREGDAIPGGVLSDLRLSPLGGDSSGNVAFYVALGPADRRVFRGSGGPLQQIVASGDALQGSTIAQLVVPVAFGVNAGGQIQFWASLADARELLLLHTPGMGTAVVATTGQALPAGGSISGNGGTVAFVEVALDDAGRVVFRAHVAGSSSPEPEALFLWQAGALTELLRTGGAAPGGGVYGDIGTHSRSDALGRVAFWATVSGSRPDENTRVFRSEAGVVVELLREGAPAPNGDGVVYFDGYSGDRLLGTGAGALFSTEIDASSDSPPPLVNATRCRNLQSPPHSHCGAHEGGIALIEDAAPVPRLRALRVLADTTFTYHDSDFDLFLSERLSDSPAPGQTGQGSSASEIRWGVVTGWTLSGSRWCQALPGALCTLAGAMQRQTVDPTAASDFYDLGTWSFHGTGFVATPYLLSRSELSNQQLRLLGRRTQNGAVPALPLLGIAVLAGAVVAAARSLSIRRSD